jgi:hypothetical protein
MRLQKRLAQAGVLFLAAFTAVRQFEFQDAAKETEWVS